jgi:diguanylate cyclase (GGDEF)-like protein/putative nucleotidyltransferase with HDIG domain
MMASDGLGNEALRTKVYNVLKGQGGQLQLIPNAAIKLLKLTSDEQADMRDLARVIETEPTLATEILKIVNSSLYHFPQPINSVQHAVSILGFSTIRNTALKLLFFHNLSYKTTRGSFDSLFFWQHCLFVATVSREIAIVLNYPDPDLIYTAGLIHDIGKLALESYGIISYSQFISDYDGPKLPILESERDCYGVTHEQVGLLLCQEWQLPAIISAVVAGHNSAFLSSEAFTDYRQEVAIVAFADYLGWIQGIGSFDTVKPIQLTDLVLAEIDLRKLDLEQLLSQVDLEMRDTGQFYGIKFPALSQLRSNLVRTVIALEQVDEREDDFAEDAMLDGKQLLASLTIPHQSLEPRVFIPQTLRAIAENFGFDRVFMLNMASRQRSLVATYCWPVDLGDETFEIKVEALGGDLLTCLRTRHAAIISGHFNKNHKLLKQLGVDEFMAVPVLRNNRLTAVLYADNKASRNPLSEKVLNQISPIANELGSALFNAKRFEVERSKAEVDPLTGLSNKRMLINFLEKLFAGGSKQLQKVAIGFLDIDHFKQLNDSCGHQMGDVALKIMADILRGFTRTGDFVGRYGGEEFLFVLHDSSPAGAFQYAERIRSEIEAKGKLLQHRFKGQAMTVSIGIAMYQSDYKNYQDFVDAADKAMYQAKNSGRNKVVSINRQI